MVWRKEKTTSRPPTKPRIGKKNECRITPTTERARRGGIYANTLLVGNSPLLHNIELERKLC